MTKIVRLYLSAGEVVDDDLLREHEEVFIDPLAAIVAFLAELNDGKKFGSLVFREEDDVPTEAE